MDECSFTICLIASISLSFSILHIDDTYEKCYGYTQGMKENDGYSGSSSAKGTDAGRQKKARQKELLEEYLEKRAQAKKQQLEMLNKKIAKMELERSRQTQSWNSERQMAKASNAYDANIMMEAELVKNITKTMEISNNQSYYINPNTRQFTSNVKNTAIKDREVFNGSMQNLLNPIEDLV